MTADPYAYQWPPQEPARSHLPIWARLMFLVAFALFVAGGLLFGYIFYSGLSQRMDEPLNPVEASVPVAPDSSAPVIAAAAPALTPTPVVAAGGSTLNNRVNILLLGIDQRESEAGQPTRTDTMILLTVDPVNKTMGMLSIPRDLWVAIPDPANPTEDRINMAHVLGDVNKYPGGGVALAKKTVQYNLGVAVNYYVRIDFKGFEKIVDALGGVTINVDKAIRDDEFPDENYGVMTVYFPAGVQHMDGATALRFVRTRHTDSDIGRMRRQLQFLMAMRDQVLKLNILPKAPSLINQFRDSVKTDLSANELISLARVAGQVDSDHIVARAIDENMVTRWTTPGGADVLVPKRDEIKKVVDQVFYSTAAQGASVQQAAPAAVPTPVKLQSAEAEHVQEEGARIEVLNGTSRTDMAAQVAAYLSTLGYNVVSVGDAGRQDYKDSVLVSYALKPFTQSGLAKAFNVAAQNVRSSASTRTDVDIRLIVGASAPTQ